VTLLGFLLLFLNLPAFGFSLLAFGFLFGLLTQLCKVGSG
jgi:hypothetical protein